MEFTNLDTKVTLTSPDASILNILHDIVPSHFLKSILLVSGYFSLLNYLFNSSINAPLAGIVIVFLISNDCDVITSRPDAYPAVISVKRSIEIV